MIYRNYNDYEIINLVKQGNDEAFNFMVDKYKFLIAKKIKMFNLGYDYDDCFQEALMVLHRSIMRFDDKYNKTFTRYFEGNLVNYLITYKKRQSNYLNFKSEKLPMLYHLQINEEETEVYLDKTIIHTLASFSNFEKRVYQARIIDRLEVRKCAELLNCEEKKVYNAIDRIRNKIKLHMMT
jgi:RNA polymerase sporulation-specific sigma factor